MTDPTHYPALANPHVGIAGGIDYEMYKHFKEQLANARDADPMVICVTTLGGDPEVARAMGEDIRLIQAYEGRSAIFLGKVAVYSAGATFMSYFARENRFLTAGTRLLIHERQISKNIHLEGPLRMCVASLKAVLHEIEHSVLIEEEGFHQLIDQSNLKFEDLRERAPENWYIEAEEAKQLGLVLDVI